MDQFGSRIFSKSWFFSGPIKKKHTGVLFCFLKSQHNAKPMGNSLRPTAVLGLNSGGSHFFQKSFETLKRLQQKPNKQLRDLDNLLLTHCCFQICPEMSKYIWEVLGGGGFLKNAQVLKILVGHFGVDFGSGLTCSWFLTMILRPETELWTPEIFILRFFCVVSSNIWFVSTILFIKQDGHVSLEGMWVHKNWSWHSVEETIVD